MSAPDLTHFDELLSRYLDASLGDADEHELLTHLSDEVLAARFHEATQLDVEIAGVLAGSIPDEVMVDLVLSDLAQGDRASREDQPIFRETMIPASIVTRTKRSWTPALLALAAVVVLLVTVAIFCLPHTPTPHVAAAPGKEVNVTVSAVHGKVYFLSTTGRTPLTKNQSLKDGGTIETAGPLSEATVTLSDGTEIELRGNTSLTAEFRGSERRLFLRQGVIVATVTKQPENAPLVFNTDRATATVRGTQLALVAETSGTYLIVTKGSVALQRLSGGPEVLIHAGFYGHVELEGQFHPFPISRLPRALQEELPEP